MNRPTPISVFSDQHRTKSTTRSRTSCGTHTWVRAPQDFFLKRCARPSTRPTPRPWSGSSFPGMRFVVVRLGGPGGPCLGRRQRRSRRTLFASGRIPLAATPVPHTDRKSALCPTSAVSGWQPSLLRCSAFSVFPCVLSVILTEERPLQFQLRQDKRFIGRSCAWGRSDRPKCGNGFHAEGNDRRRRSLSLPGAACWPLRCEGRADGFQDGDT